MTCPCKKHAEPEGIHAHPFAATEPCPYCAEKHLAAAAALAREYGYQQENRAFVAGELVAAAWHLPPGDPFAARFRDARHAVQARPPRPVDWTTLCRDFSEAVDLFAAEEAAKAIDRQGADE